TANGTWQGIVSKLRYSPYNGYGLLKAWNNKFAFYLMDSSSGSYSLIYSDVSYTDENWHHVVVVRRNGVNYLYVDGIKQANTSTGTIGSSDLGLVLGKFYVNFSFSYFKGLIDEVRILNRGLSGSEILANYQKGELNYLSPTTNSYKDYNIINAATGVYLGNSFDYYIKACNLGGCAQGTSGNIFFNDPNSACNPFAAVLIESEARCEPDGFGGIDAFANLKWYDFFPDSVSDYEVLIDGSSTSTTAENYILSDEKEYIDFEKILGEFFEGNTYSFILRSNPKNPIFSGVDSNPISLGIPNCDAPTKPTLEEPIPNCNEDQPEIKIIWSDSDDANSYDLYEINKGFIFNITDDDSLTYNHTDTIVSLDTIYNYYVISRGNNGSYNISDTVSTTTPVVCYNTPLKPIISSITGECDNSSPREPYIEIKWNRQPEDNNTDYYEIWRTDQGTRLNVLDILDSQDSFNSYNYIGTDSKGVDSDIVANVQYKYYLIGIGSGGFNESDLNEITAPDCGAVPEIPGNFLVATDCYGYCDGGANDGEACNENADCDSNNCIISFIDGASMVLDWDRTANTFQYIIWKDCGDGYDYDSTIDEVGYNNYDPDNSDIIYTTSSITYIAHLSEEYIGEDCFYDVKSVGWGGVSTSTDLIGDTVKICGNTPMAAQNFGFGAINCEDVTLTWTDGTDIGYIGDGSDESAGEFYFQAYRADDAGCVNYINISGNLSPSNQNVARSYTDSLGLNEENDYCWKIVSWNPAGSATTSFITVQTPKCPPGPSVLQKDLLSCEKISLKWKRSENYLFKENATAYEVYSGIKTSPKETLEETLSACRCVDYSADGGCGGFSTISDGAGAGNCDSDNNLFCADADNCCHTDCDASFFCDGSGSQLKCYNLTNKRYYYREINSDGFTPGGTYYYILEVEPLEVGLETTDSNQLKIQPCPALPEWKEVGF
ncbi:LamG domain-containing protein, partial [Candidatus Parcubacteria bacterium]|nr:LamG domain-containing protein [Candidatus Parcubacteria bacterium]